MSSVAESRAAFAERFPKIVESLDRPGAVSSSLIEENGTIVDAMVVDDVRLYNSDAHSFAAGQVEAFMDKPLRLFMERPTNAGLISPVCVKLHDALGEFLIERGVEEIRSQVSDDSPRYLVVFGLGLGHHIEALARRTKARWLIIVEPIADFIAHSFHTVDWPSLFAHFEKQGGGIEIVTKLDPGEMISGIVRYMTAQGIPYVDGTYVFTHYPFWAFAEARNRLYEAVEFAFINRGFYEDELVMMTNAVTNFAAAPIWLIEGRPRLHRPELAVVVGAGLVARRVSAAPPGRFATVSCCSPPAPRCGRSCAKVSCPIFIASSRMSRRRSRPWRRPPNTAESLAGDALCLGDGRSANSAAIPRDNLFLPRSVQLHPDPR